MSTYPAVGDILDDKYELLESLGSGGIGTVFKALQLDCKRIVAVKILHLHIAVDDEYKARFLQEARALSQISHRGIVSVYHMGSSASGISYLVMEFLEGRSLFQLLQSEDKLLIDRAIKITSELARALSAVHKLGIVHRDLKPANILLMSEPEPDSIKIVDFGLAKIVSTGDQKLTSTGQLMGTAAYMSPEQCKGEVADSRSDIYSLTVCFYEMITGKIPFEADTAIGLMHKHLMEPPPVIKAEQVDKFDQELSRFILKSLAKNPDDRFASMDEYAKQLEHVATTLKASGHASLALKPIKIIVTILIILLSGIIIWKVSASHTLATSPKDIKRKSLAGVSSRSQLKMITQEWNVDPAIAYEMARESLLAPSDPDNLAKLLTYAAQLSPYGGERVYYSLKALRLAPASGRGEQRIVHLNSLLSAVSFLISEGLFKESERYYSLAKSEISRYGIPPYIYIDRINCGYADLHVRFSRAKMLTRMKKRSEANKIAEGLFSDNSKSPSDLRATSRSIAELFLDLGNRTLASKVNSLTQVDADKAELSAAFLEHGLSAEANDCLIHARKNFNSYEYINPAKQIIGSRSYQPDVGRIHMTSVLISIFSARYDLEQGERNKGALSLLAECKYAHTLIPIDVALFATALMQTGAREEAFRFFQHNHAAGKTSIILQDKDKAAIIAIARQQSKKMIDPRLIDCVLRENSLSPLDRCLTLLLRSKYPATDGYGNDFFMAEAFDIVTGAQGNRIPDLLKWNCLQEYSQALTETGLPHEAIRIANMLLEQLEKSGSKDPELKKLKLLSSISNLINLDKLGEKKQAELIAGTIEISPSWTENYPWFKAFDAERLLNRNSEAKALMNNCTDPSALREMAMLSITQDDLDLAAQCLNRSISLPHLSSFDTTMNTIAQALLFIENGDQAAARERLAKVLHNDFSKLSEEERTKIYDRLLLGLALTHMDKEAEQIIPHLK